MHGFVGDLAIVLMVASATGLLFRRLGQPAALGYLLAGLIVGPYIPIPVFADPARTHALSDLGVVFVMFVVGLELRFKRLFAVLPTAGVTTLIEVFGLWGAGFALGRALGWSAMAAVFLGASIAISSTMLVSKVFEDRPVAPELRDHVMSILVVQDILAIILATALSALASGHEVSTGHIALLAGRLSGWLLVVVVLGLMVIPRLVRRVANMESRELLVVTCTGLCFGLSLLAQALGYSVALGAFFAGVLVAESGEGYRVEVLVQPLRDLFAAIFFVAVGMEVEPRLAIANIGTSLLVFAVVVVMQTLSVAFSGVLSGNGLRRSVAAGLSLAQVGEFGFILASIGTRSGAAPPALGSIVVTVAVLTAFTTPVGVAHAERVVRFIDRMLPPRLQDLLSLYEAWFERLRNAPKTEGPSRLKRTIWVLAFEGLSLLALALFVSWRWSRLAALVREHTALPDPWNGYAIIGGAVMLSIPPAMALAHASRALGAQVTERVFGSSSSDAGVRPGRLLEVGVRLVVLLAVGVPCAVVLLPFAGGSFVLVLVVFVGALSWALWRTAGQYVPEVQTSAGKLLDFLARQTAQEGVHPADRSTLDPQSILGEAERVALDDSAFAVGRTLSDLDLRASTGATVIAIRSPELGHRVPTGREPLRAGDVLLLAGSHDSLGAARDQLLHGPGELNGPRELDEDERSTGTRSATTR